MLDLIKNQVNDLHDESVFVNCKNDTLKFYNLSRHVIIPPISHTRYVEDNECLVPKDGMDSLSHPYVREWYLFRNPMKVYNYSSFMDYEVSRIELYKNEDSQ